MTSHESVLDYFRYNAQARPEDALYVFVDAKGRDQERLTQGQFDLVLTRLNRAVIASGI